MGTQPALPREPKPTFPPARPQARHLRRHRLPPLRDGVRQVVVARGRPLHAPLRALEAQSPDRQPRHRRPLGRGHVPLRHQVRRRGAQRPRCCCVDAALEGRLPGSLPAPPSPPLPPSVPLPPLLACSRLLARAALQRRGCARVACAASPGSPAAPLLPPQHGGPRGPARGRVLQGGGRRGAQAVGGGAAAPGGLLLRRAMSAAAPRGGEGPA
jgi:hypothetical protein